MDYDVIVVGGGPAGCAVARDVAASGYKVLVAEEHRRPGEPLQCAGLISPRTLELSGVSRRVVLNRLYGARVHAPGGRVLRLEGERVYALAVDRIAFDRELAGQAVRAGATVATGMRVTGLEYISGGVAVEVAHNGNRERLTCRLVVGADGHNSTVASWLGVSRPPVKVRMYAAEVELPQSRGNIVDIFLGRRVAPGWFGWVIPVGGGRARVGTGASAHPRRYMDALEAEHPGIFHGMRVIRRTSGVVPVGMMEKTYGRHALLVGDAACQVKPISGGGLYLGLKAARICAATALEALAAGDFGEEFLSRYRRAWEEDFGMEIRCGMHHREAFLEMSDEEMDRLIGFFDRPYWRRLILKYGDIDYHSALARRLSQAPPWARRFAYKGMKLALNLFP